MRRREFICFLVFGSVCACVASAQQSAKKTKIGYLSPFSASPIPAAAKNLQAFRQNLEHLGHAEGRDIAIEFRYAGDNFDRLPSLAAELVEREEEVIVKGAPSKTPADNQARST